MTCVAVAAVSLGVVLAGVPGARAGSRGGSPQATFNLFFGPVSLASGQELIVHGRNVSDTASPMVELAYFDATGAMTISISAAVAPNQSIDLFQTGSGYFWARVRTMSPLVRGSLELVDPSTGRVLEVTGPTPVLRGGSNLASGGPVLMSDDDSEVVSFTNVSTTLRSVAITFYDDIGTVLENWTQTIGSMQTATKAFPSTFEGNFVAFEMTVSGSGPSIIAASVTTDANGLMSAYNQAETLASS